MNNEQMDVYIDAIKKYGSDNQVNMLYEETEELIVAISKYRRNPCEETITNVQEEIADVQIMIDQMKLIFGKKYIEEFIEKKTTRLKNRIEEKELVEVVCGTHGVETKEYQWVNKDDIELKVGDIVLAETKYGEKPVLVTRVFSGTYEEFKDYKKIIRNETYRKEKKKPVFRLKDFSGMYAMHCDTEEKAKKFLEFLHRCGKGWRGGESYLEETNWETYRKDTCYFFNYGTFGTFGSLQCAGEINYTVLEFDDFDWSDMYE